MIINYTELKDTRPLIIIIAIIVVMIVILFHLSEAQVAFLGDPKSCIHACIHASALKSVGK